MDIVILHKWGGDINKKFMQRVKRGVKSYGIIENHIELITFKRHKKIFYILHKMNIFISEWIVWINKDLWEFW